jgi:hypothetical protein
VNESHGAIESCVERERYELRIDTSGLVIFTAVCEFNGTSPTVRKYRYVRETQKNLTNMGLRGHERKSRS